jgi:hypothetical protein
MEIGEAQDSLGGAGCRPSVGSAPYTTFRPTSRLAQGRCRRRAAESTAARRSTNQIHPSAALAVRSVASPYASEVIPSGPPEFGRGRVSQTMRSVMLQPIRCFCRLLMDRAMCPAVAMARMLCKSIQTEGDPDLSEQNCGLATKRGVWGTGPLS